MHRFISEDENIAITALGTWDRQKRKRMKEEKARPKLTRNLCRDYIQIRAPVYISHSAGRYAVKRFRKAQCPIIERLTNSLMMNGRNNGKKLMAVRIVAHAFEIVRLSKPIE